MKRVFVSTVLVLVFIAAEHLIALFLSPWNRLSLAPSSSVVSAHLVARVFALILVLVIACRQWLASARWTAEQGQPSAPAPAPRPLSVAEWEARHDAR